jgi:hypothetical protein
MSIESEESTIIHLEVMRIAHLKALQTLQIGLTEFATEMIQMTAMTIAQWIMNQIWTKRFASGIRIAQIS